MTHADRPEEIIFSLLCAVDDRIFFIPFLLLRYVPDVALDHSSLSKVTESCAIIQIKGSYKRADFWERLSMPTAHKSDDEIVL